MATLTNTKIKDTYPGLLKITDNGVVEATEQVVTDGLGNNTVLSIGTGSASFSSDIEVNTLTIGLGSGSIATNTALGLDALLSNTTGSGNVSVGQGSLRSNTTGSTNVAVGKDSLRANTTGGFNSSLGYNSLTTNTTGAYNTSIGNSALLSNSTGSRNTALGYFSGDTITTGTDNLYIGYQADASAADVTNEIVIGASATGNGSNTATYGNASITSHHFTSGQVNISGNLAVDTNTLYVDAANNRVGVGTSSPATTLELNSATSNQAVLKIGRSTNPAITNNLQLGTSGGDSTITAIGTSSVNAALIFQRGTTSVTTESMRIDSSGRVDISGAINNAVTFDRQLQTRGALISGISGTTTAQLYLHRDDVTINSGDIIGELNYSAADGGSYVGAAITAIAANNWGGSNSPTHLSFQTADTGLNMPTERMRIDSSGNVGIGANPVDDKLHILGDSVKIQQQGQAGITFKFNHGNNTSINSDVNYANIKSLVTSGVTGAESGALTFETRNSGTTTERMRIDSSGNVGINTSPFTRFTVVGDSAFSPSASGGKATEGVHIRATAGGSGNYGGGISLDTGSVGASAIVAVQESADADVNGLAFFTHGSGTGSASSDERMRIDSAGNVLIQNSDARLRGGDTTGRLIISNSDTTSYIGINGISNASPSDVYTVSRTNIIFTTGSPAPTERMRIDSAGNVLVGSTTAAAKMHIQGGSVIASLTDWNTKANTTFSLANPQVRLGIGYDASDIPLIQSFNTVNAARNLSLQPYGGGVYIGASARPNGTSVYGSAFVDDANDRLVLELSSSTTGTVVLQRFYNPNGAVGTITTSGSATAYNTSSDYRLKENVVPMEGALDRVDALKPSRFNFIADPEKTVDGFLAHEVQAIIPEAVTGEKDAVDEEGNPIYQGIDQSKITPLLTAAIKELKAIVDAQAEKIAILESKLNA